MDYSSRSLARGKIRPIPRYNRRSSLVAPRGILVFMSELVSRPRRQPHTSAPLKQHADDGRRAFFGLGLAGLKIAMLSARIKQMEEEASRKQKTLTTIFRELSNRLDRPGNTLQLPDGYVTEVNEERQEVLVNITLRQVHVPA